MIASNTYHRRLCDVAEIIGSNLQGRICGKMIRKQISPQLQPRGSSSDTQKYFFQFFLWFLKVKQFLETIDLIKLPLKIDFYGRFMTILEISHFSNQHSSGFKIVSKNQFWLALKILCMVVKRTLDANFAFDARYVILRKKIHQHTGDSWNLVNKEQN